MNKVIDEFLVKKQDNEMSIENKELFCNILIKRMQQIQVNDLANKLISVEIKKSDKTLNLKFQLF